MPVAGSIHRPRVSRETRRLLGAAALALLALWVLARLRFPDAPVAPNPVPPLLAQLAPPARFAELASEVGLVSDRVRGAMMTLPPQTGGDAALGVALRVRPGIGASVVPLSSAGALPTGVKALSVDRPSGLVLVAYDQVDAVSLPRPWAPTQAPSTQYLFATAPADGGVVVRPEFVTLSAGVHSPVWNADLWKATADHDLPVGTFLFTASGEFAGVTTADADGFAIVPADRFYAAVEALIAAPDLAGTGWLGIHVTPLTQPLAAATGVAAGALVLDVDPNTSARGQLSPGDVVLSVNDVPVAALSDWSASVGRLRVGDAVRLRVATSAGFRDVQVMATAFPPPPAAQLGARLQRIGGRTEVLTVARGSSAAASGLLPGDIITRAGDVLDPTPAQVTHAFATAADAPLLVLFSRGGAHHAVALER